MGGSNTVKITAGHGLSGSGKGHPPTSGVTGAGGSFVGTTTPQDIQRNVKETSGENSGKKVPSNVGVKNTSRAGGMNRKFAGKVGPGGYSGTN